jgi:uncharacterized RDD family membrane protein YckC
MYCQSCGNVFRGKPAVAADVTAGYAGFWQRFLATLIDWIVVVAASVIISVVSFGALTPASFFLAWLYEAFLTSSEWQATLGKRALNIVVVGLDGNPISFWRATGRHFAKYLSAFILFIGYIMAAFTEKKQALHDMMAETVVRNR